MRPVRIASGALSVAFIASLAAAAVGGCTGHDDVGPSSAALPSPAVGSAAPAASPAIDSPVGIPTGQDGGDSTTIPSPEQISAAWAIRPAYVSGTGRDVEAAYAFAVARPDIVEWMPCYCGCGGMGHDSNLSCFLKPRAAGGSIGFEEHASYCDICIQTALMAKRMFGEGASLTEMRDAVDATFGANGVPGTPTELPPS